jgi:hypothetical protein
MYGSEGGVEGGGGGGGLRENGKVDGREDPSEEGTTDVIFIFMFVYRSKGDLPI